MKRAAGLLSIVLTLSGCERAMHDMYDQPRYKPLAAAPDLPNGTSSLPPPPESIAHSRGNLAGVASGRAGGAAALEADLTSRAQAMPSAVTLELIHRGQERYAIYCMPCHGPAGAGDGLIARRGFPNPPSYHIARLREAPDRHFYDVITNGYGIMYSYADRVPPNDRWAIVAYIRALQLSQNADVARLPPDVRAKLSADVGAKAPAK